METSSDTSARMSMLQQMRPVLDRCCTMLTLLIATARPDCRQRPLTTVPNVPLPSTPLTAYRSSSIKRELRSKACTVFGRR